MPQETVLITGASSGIGLELAKRFAADKCNLILVARSQDKLDSLAAAMRQEHGIQVLVLAKDLANPAAPQEIFDQLTAQGIIVDVVVNNAGFGSVGTVAELPIDRQLDMVQVNVVALMLLARLFLPGMIQRGRGGVLNVGSTAGFQPGPGMAVYYATKAFVLSFTEALAEELAGTGVGATCLAPGPTETGFGADSGMGETLIFKLGMMDAATVARIGYRAYRRRKPLVISGWTNRIGAFLVRLAPRALVRKVVIRLQK